MEAATFVAGTLSLLAVPGPTNTLLATAGARNGFQRSVPLLAAELSGYAFAIMLLWIAVGPMVAALPAFGIALHAVVVAYLVYLAAILWRHRGDEIADTGPVTMPRVFVTTSLNPKAIIFAFALLPSAGTTDIVALMPWLMALALQIVIVGTCWIAAGVSLRRRFQGVIHAKLGYRASASALILLAGVLAAHAISIA